MPKMPKRQKIKQRQSADSDTDSEYMPIDILDEELYFNNQKIIKT